MEEKGEHLLDFISNRIDRRDLHEGDHIYSWRGIAYTHHGIYVGNEEVIHFGSGKNSNTKYIIKLSRSNLRSTSKKTACSKCSTQLTTEGVTKSCLDCFLDGGKLYRYRYGVTKDFLSKKRSGTCTMEESEHPDAVVYRAKYLFQNRACFGPYDLLKNNCEDFAIYCKTGTLLVMVGGSGQANNKWIRRLFHRSKDIEKTKRKVQVEEFVKINCPN